MKDHEIAQTVNHLRDIAIQFHDAQQLRERIADVIVPLLKKEKPERDSKALVDGVVEGDMSAISLIIGMVLGKLSILPANERRSDLHQQIIHLLPLAELEKSERIKPVGRVIYEVRTLAKKSFKTGAFQDGMETACDEIEERLKT